MCYILIYQLLERETRFELATPTLARLCSTTELFPREYGAPGRIRTSDRLVRSQVLYPAELRVRIDFSTVS